MSTPFSYTKIMLSSLRKSLLRFVAITIYRSIYRTRITGRENIPLDPCVFVANHTSYIDAFVLNFVCKKPVRFIAWDGFRSNLLMRILLDVVGVIYVSPDRSKDAIRKAVSYLEKGESVCIFPEGTITRHGSLNAIKSGYQIIAKKAGVPIVPIYIQGLWGSIFSHESGRVFFAKPKRFPYPVNVAVGAPEASEELSPEKLKGVLQGLSVSAMNIRKEFSMTLGAACVYSLKKQLLKKSIIDRTTGSSRYFRSVTFLAASLVLVPWIQRMIQARRVGIALPPGMAGFAANLGVLLAGKVPVNLNLTMGEAVLGQCVDVAELDTIISAEKYLTKLGNPKLPSRVLLIEEYFHSKTKLYWIWNYLKVFLLPASRIIPSTCSRDVESEAGVIFTSGSSGQPKGVVLSHRNIQANIYQIMDTGLVQEGTDTLLASLPLFHSFGFTVTMWLPLVRSVRCVTIPSPLDSKAIITAIEDEKVTVHLGTAAFLRPVLKKASSESMSSLRYVIAGAEKIPVELSEGWFRKFGSPILEGYGMTEASPVISVNAQDIFNYTEGKVFSRNCSGSVGRLLTGVAVRFRDPQTGKLCSEKEGGILEVSGPNIFQGYLNNTEATNSVIKDGWYDTGDIVRVDDAGFLHAEGRLSRFSKIGGEMVPHVRIENTIKDCLKEMDIEVACVVMARPQKQKGEELVLLLEGEVPMKELQSRLREEGLPNIWIPKICKHIDCIPQLGSGKVDLFLCKQVALEC